MSGQKAIEPLSLEVALEQFDASPQYLKNFLLHRPIYLYSHKADALEEQKRRFKEDDAYALRAQYDLSMDMPRDIANALPMEFQLMLIEWKFVQAASLEAAQSLDVEDEAAWKALKQKNQEGLEALALKYPHATRFVVQFLPHLDALFDARFAWRSKLADELKKWEAQGLRGRDLKVREYRYLVELFYSELRFGRE